MNLKNVVENITLTFFIYHDFKMSYKDEIINDKEQYNLAWSIFDICN